MTRKLKKKGDIFFFSKIFGDKKKRDDKEEKDHEEMLCRFVLDGAGKKIGESIAVDDDLLIIKSDDEYMGVPLKHLEKQDKTLLVKGLVDRDQAVKLGEKWREKAHYEIDHPESED
ncbi:MAG: DUF5749 family beta-barrel protein [Candidatus Thermoplasmatota archaeon]